MIGGKMLGLTKGGRDGLGVMAVEPHRRHARDSWQSVVPAGLKFLNGTNGDSEVECGGRSADSMPRPKTGGCHVFRDVIYFITLSIKAAFRMVSNK
jgi:hypothetical protein